MFGEIGDDLVRGQGGSDFLSGGLGDDRIDGGVGDNILQEEVDADLTLSTTAGIHQLTGAGTDTLVGTFFAARLTGGSSSNRLDVTGFSGSATLAGAGGNDTLLGSAFSDVLAGGAGNDSLASGGGNDSLFGEDGDDLLQGGADNDVLRGGRGTDGIDGEAGDDRFSEQGNTNIVINGFVVTSTLLGTDTAQNIERFELTGGSGANLLDARLSSLPVMLSGGTGNDTLLGSAFADDINGGSGDDVLSGGAGQDILNGSSGRDVVYENANTSFTVNRLRLVSTLTGTKRQSPWKASRSPVETTTTCSTRDSREWP